MWIGINDKTTEGSWISVETKTSATYFNWNKEEPNNAGSGEDCAEMISDDGKWNDGDCANTLNYICKKSITILSAGTYVIFWLKSQIIHQKYVTNVISYRF